MLNKQSKTILDEVGEMHRDLRAFSAFQRRTAVREKNFTNGQVAVYENEFWTAKQRCGHSLHEVSYRACYKPQLPSFFIERFCYPDDVVYDPFMGRGTTLIEAQLRGCRAIGNDVNPLSLVLTAPRLNPPTIGQVAERLVTVRLRPPKYIDTDLLVFFSPETLGEIYGWQAYFRQQKNKGLFDAIDAWIQMVACNRLTGHSKGFFSVFTLPPNQAASLTSQRRINQKRQQSPEYRDTKALILKKTKQLLRHSLPLGYGRDDFNLISESADYTPTIPTNSVDLVVTSPPFLDTVDYIADNWLRMWFCEIEIDAGRIWQIKSVSDWVARMTAVFRELKRVLKPEGVIAFEVGEVRNGAILLENEVTKAGSEAGLVPECIIINSHHFTKTANCWGVSNNTKGTNSNRIVILKNDANKTTTAAQIITNAVPPPAQQLLF